MGKHMEREVDEVRRNVEPRMSGAKVHKYNNLIAKLGGLACMFPDDCKERRREFEKVKEEIYELMKDCKRPY